jgi:hypothetical protein
MKYRLLPVIVASLTLGALGVTLPLNTKRLLLIFLVAGLSGALCSYLIERLFTIPLV